MIIWQPTGVYQPGCGFDIALDGEFARQMVSSHVGEERQRVLVQLGKETARRFDFRYPEVFSFHEDTGLVTMVNIGDNGCWLNLDNRDFDKLVGGEQIDKLVYSNHNVDSFKQAYALMSLVDLWVSYAGVLRGE